MREILFRGKCGIGKVWVCGYYTKRDNDGDIEHRIEGISGASFRMIPETLGQWTGLKDKNGKQIFEGDILKGYQYPFYNEANDAFNYYAIVTWFDTAFGLLSIKAPNAKVLGRNAGNVDDMEDFSSDEWEIIGNIHDSPELVEVNRHDI